MKDISNKCDECEKDFGSGEDLFQHLAVVHEGFLSYTNEWFICVNILHETVLIDLVSDKAHERRFMFVDSALLI